MFNSRYSLLVIIFLGFFTRVYITFYANLLNIHTDTGEYIKQASAILDGEYINFYPNGYPLLIAAVKASFGSVSLTMLLWLNILFSTATIYFAYSIAKKIFGQQYLAVIAALITAFFPSQLNSVRWLMTEVPSTFFLLGAYFFYYKKNYWICGLFLGIATLIRTEILVIIFVLLVLDARQYKKFNVAFFTGAIVPMLLLGWFCYIKTGEFSLAGHNRFNIIVATWADGGNVDFSYPGKHPEINTNAKAISVYMGFLKNTPFIFMKSRLANLWELWGFYTPAEKGGPGLVGRIVSGAGNFFLIAFGLYAWWKNRKMFAVSLLILPFIIITLIHVVFFALHRYTCPIEPFLIILASWSICWLLIKPQRKLNSGKVLMKPPEDQELCSR